MRSKISILFTLSVVTLLLFNCKKKDKDKPEEVTPPTPSNLATLTTVAVTNITDSTAVSGGNITAEGASAITAVGICWDTLSSPTTLKPHTNNGAGTGSYSSNMTGLKVNKKYYVRAYATNGHGTAYGNEISFLTPSYNLWTKSNSASTYTSFNCLLSNGAQIFAGTSNGIVFSADTGNTWVTKGLSSSYIINLSKKGTTLFANDINGGLHRSTDNGNNWTDISNNFPYTVRINDVAQLGSKLIAGTDSSAWISSDDGNSWTSIKNGLPTPTPSWGGGGVYKTISSGSQVYAFGSKFIGPGYENRFYKYDEPNNNWIPLLYFTQQTYLKSKISGNNIFIASSNGGFSAVEISTDGGNNWNTVTSASGSDVDAYGSNVFIPNSTSSFSLSTNQGSTWSQVKDIGLPPTANRFESYISGYYLWMNTTTGIYKYRYN